MATYIARSPYRSYVRNGSAAVQVFSKMAAFTKLAYSRKNKASRSARTMRHLRATTAGHHSVSSRYSLSSLGERRTGALKSAINRFKGVKMSYEIGISFIIVGLLVVAIASSLLYLAHFNQVATKGYELKRLEADHQQLINQYEIKNLKLAEVKALKSIANSERVSAMQRPVSVEFVHGNTAIASR